MLEIQFMMTLTKWCYGWNFWVKITKSGIMPESGKIIRNKWEKLAVHGIAEAAQN